VELTVVGEIPVWAAGSLYRTGPGQAKVEGTPAGTHHISHWFDGLAHSHRFEIEPGPDGGRVRVVYSSRRQSEQLVKHLQSRGGARGMSFGQRRDPCVGFLAKFMSTFMAVVGKHVRPPRPRALENVCVTVLPDMPGLHAPADGAADNSPGGRPPANVYLATDTTMLKRIDPVSLEPIGVTTQVALHPELTGPVSCSHAQRDPDTGDIFNFNLEFSRVATYRIFRVDAATGQTEILATMQRPDVRPAYVHSFFLTRNYVVLCLPCSHYSWGGAKMLWEKNVIDAIEPFDPSRLCRWFVFDRRGRGLVAELESDAAFFFHTVNAFEEEKTDDGDSPEEDGTARISIVCDLIEYLNFDIVRSLYYDALLDQDGAAGRLMADPEKVTTVIPRLTRYRLTFPASAATQAVPPSQPATPVAALRAEKILAIRGPHAGELPTINPAYSTRKHRYVYSLPTRGLSTLVDTIAKTDTHTGEALLWDNPRGHTPGEAIFVARPGAADEDDGVLLSVVLDGVEADSYLLCLDARTMKEVGRAEVGFALPLGFHGIMHPQVGDGARE